MNKPKGIYIGTNEAINRAFSDRTQKKLSEKLDMFPVCLEKAAFENNPDILRTLGDVEYVFSTWGMAELSEEQIKTYLPKLKAVFYAAGTVRYFAKPFLNCGVKVFSAWAANAVPVAEVTVSEILLANKGFFQTLHRGGAGEWTEHDAGTPHPGNFNTSVGIIGAGMIGTMVIERLVKNYKLNVFVFDKFMSKERIAGLGATKVESLPDIFEKCHVVSNHLANNPQTENMIDKACFERMAQNGVFINTGRGKQVVERDLIDALKNESARCAVLDVTCPEPPEKDSELYKLPNVFLTPHLAGSIGGEIQRMGEYMLEEFTAFSENGKTKYEVTEKMLETMA